MCQSLVHLVPNRSYVLSVEHRFHRDFMKFLITVVQAYDADKFLRAVTGEGLRATRINSVGGFLRMANATMLMALSEEDVPRALAIIRETCRRRVEVRLDAEGAEYFEWFEAGVHEVPIGGAVVFVMPMDYLAQIYPDRILKHTKTPVD